MFNRCWPASGWSRTPQLLPYDDDDDDDDEEKDVDDDEVNENENKDEDDDEDVEPSIIPSGWRGETKRRDEEGRR